MGVRSRLPGLSIASLLVVLAALLAVSAAGGVGAARLEARIPSGRTLFVAACGGCHTFAPAGTKGTKGPNLADEGPNYADVVSQIVEGGDGMPAFGGSLTRVEVRAIAVFVANTASSSGEGTDE